MNHKTLSNTILSSLLLSMLLMSSSLWSKQKVESIYYLVNDDMITQTEYEETERYFIQSANQSGTPTPSPGQVISNMITSLLIKQEAIKSGSSITKTDILNSIQRIVDMNNLESIENLKKILPTQGLSWELFYKMQENQHYTEEFIGRFVTATDPTADELEKYYEKYKKEKFDLKENKLYRLARIQLIPPGEKAFKEFRKKKAEAQKIYDKLIEGADFQTLAKEISEDVSTKNTGGDMGWFFSSELDDLLLIALKDLKEGQFTEPFADSQNYLNIVKITELKDKGYVPFDKAKELIKNIIISERKQIALADRLKKTIRDSYIVKKTDYFGGYQFK